MKNSHKSVHSLSDIKNLVEQPTPQAQAAEQVVPPTEKVSEKLHIHLMKEGIDRLEERLKESAVATEKPWYATPAAKTAGVVAIAVVAAVAVRFTVAYFFSHGNES